MNLGSSARNEDIEDLVDDDEMLSNNVSPLPNYSSPHGKPQRGRLGPSTFNASSYTSSKQRSSVLAAREFAYSSDKLAPP